MSGILGGLSNLLFGKAKTPEADWAEIEKLMKLSTELNRTNQHGLLSGWDWSEGPNGWTQSQTINPALQPMMDNFIGRATAGPDAQLQALKDARFESMMNQPGIAPRPPARNPDGSLPRGNLDQRSGLIGQAAAHMGGTPQGSGLIGLIRQRMSQ